MASRAREYVALFSAGVAGTAVGGALAAAWLARRQRRAAGGGAFLAEQSRGVDDTDVVCEPCEAKSLDGVPVTGVPLGVDPYSPAKRQGALSWDDYFMALAFLSAQRSKDPNKQVLPSTFVLSTGYNGFPRGISDDDLPWAKLSRTGDPLETKYPFVCHAEANAILNANTDKMAGQRLYVTMFPCNECAKMIVQAGLVEVVYCEAKDDGGKQADMACYEASRRLLRLAGVRTRQHQLVRRIVAGLLKLRQHHLDRLSEVGNGKSATVAEAA
ncbi:unnamed protein product [Prorocentrum cordatum]|uniref:dCMP deaminase n=1 Tax=Prorocentrum cordatum TaxID=2364126 RepID=A0ABN9TCY9_9DINO|nr:unnamed protein product [Polarella glacialis]